MPKLRNRRTQKSQAVVSSAGVTNIVVKPLQMTGGVFNVVLSALLQIIGGFTQGVDTVGEEGERFINAFINSNVNVRLLQVFQSLGNQCKYIANELGNIIAVVPLVGETAAYIVRGTGDNVYHIVMSTNRLLTSTISKGARFVSKSLDLCVFTITAVSDEVRLIGDDVVELVENLSLRKNNTGSVKDVHASGGTRRNRKYARAGRSRSKALICYSRVL